MVHITNIVIEFLVVLGIMQKYGFKVDRHVML